MQADLTILAGKKIVSTFSVEFESWKEEDRISAWLLKHLILFLWGYLKFFFSCLYKLYKQAEANT